MQSAKPYEGGNLEVTDRNYNEKHCSEITKILLAELEKIGEYYDDGGSSETFECSSLVVSWRGNRLIDKEVALDVSVCKKHFWEMTEEQLEDFESQGEEDSESED